MSDSLPGVRVQNDQNRVKLIFGVIMSLASAWAMRGRCTSSRDAKDEETGTQEESLHKEKRKRKAVKSLTSSSFVIGLTTGILGIVSLYVEDQSKGLFHAYQAWIAFCIIGLIPVRYQRP